MTHIDIPHINYVLDVIKDIENSMNDVSKESFKKDKDKREANIRRVEIVGESLKGISRELKEKYSDVEWEKFEGIKEVFRSHYFGVDLDIVWNILNDSIPLLKERLIRISKLE